MQPLHETVTVKKGLKLNLNNSLQQLGQERQMRHGPEQALISLETVQNRHSYLQSLIGRDV